MSIIRRRQLLAGLPGIVVLGCNRSGSEAPEAKSERLESEPDPGGLEPEPVRPAVQETAVAVLAGGCFWGMEEILRDVPGVLDTEVGYAGGSTSSPSYEQVKTGETGHAESVKVVFDPQLLSFEDLLEDWFFRMHDPTTVNRQGNDVGSQYRSAIFYTSPGQKQEAERVLRKVEASGRWDDPIVTEVSPVVSFTPAESYHQDYLDKNPGGYTCHYLRD